MAVQTRKAENLTAAPKRQSEFEPIRYSPFELSPQASARVIPGCELNGSTVDLLKTAMNLLTPGFFRKLINRAIKAPHGSCSHTGFQFITGEISRGNCRPDPPVRK